MGIQDKVINLLIRGIDYFTPEAVKVKGSMDQMGESAASLKQQLAELRETNKQLTKATELEEYSKTLKTSVSETQATLAALTEEMQNTPGASAELKRAFTQASSESGRLQSELASISSELDELARTLRRSGVDIENTATEQKRLAVETINLKQELIKLNKAQKDALRLDELRTNASLAQQELNRTSAALEELSAQFVKGEKPTKALSDAHSLAKSEAQRAATAYQKLSRELEQHEAAMVKAGASTTDMAAVEKKLASEIANTQIKLQALEKTQKALGTYDKLTPQLINQTDALRKNQRELDRLREEVQQAEAPQKALAEQIGHAARMAGQAQIAYERNEAKLSALRKTLDGAGINSKQLATEQARVAKETAEATQAYEENKLKLSLLQQQLNAAKKGTHDLASGFNDMARNVVMAAGAYIGLDKLRQGLMSIVTVGGHFEVLREQLIGVYGDVAEGEKAFKWAQDLNKRLPTSLDDVLQAFVMLKNNGMEPTNGTLEKMINANVRYGRGAETLIPIIRQLTQSWGKNRIQAEEAYVLIENGLPVWQLLSEATGKSVASLQKMSEQGKLTREYMVQLIDTMGKAGAGVVERRMQTWEALVTKFRDGVKQVQDTIAQSGALDYFKTILFDINKEMTAMAEDGRMQAYAKQISDWMVESARSVKTWATDARLSFDNLMTGMTIGVQSLRVVINLFTGSVKLLGGALLAPFQLMGQLMERMAAVADSMGMTDAAEKMRNGAGLINAQFRGMMDAFYQDMADIEDASKKMADAVTRESANAGAGIDKGLKEGTGKAKATLADFEAAMAGGFRTMDDYYAAQRGGFDSLAEYLKKNGQSVEEYYAGIAEGSGQLGAELMNSFMQQAGDIDAEVEKQLSQRQAQQEKAAMDAKNAISSIFEEAGLDIEQIAGKTGKAVDQIIANMQTIRESGLASGQQLVAYFDMAFTKVKNMAELDALTQEIDEFRDAGVLVGQAYVDAYGKATDAAQKLAKETSSGTELYLTAMKNQKAAAEDAYKTGQITAAQYNQTVGELNQSIAKTEQGLAKQKVAANDLQAAYNVLGVDSAAALQQQAEAAKKAYATIAAGTSTISQQREAFLAYAEAELKAGKANNRYVDGALMAQAASLGLSEQFKALVTNINATGNEALITAAALDTLGQSAAAAQTQAEAAAKYQSASNKAQLENIDKLQEGTRSATGTMVKFATEVANANDLAGMSIDQLRVKQEEFRQVLEDSQEWLHKSNDLSTEWWEDQVLAQAVAQKQNAILAERIIKVKELEEALKSAETPNAELLRSAEMTLSTMADLGDSTLSGLRSALDSAKQKMQSLADSAASTLNSLRDEMDQYNNNLDAIEERRYQAQIADLRAKLAEAEATKNSEAVASLQEAIALADKLHQKKLADIEAERLAQAKADAEKSANANKRPAKEKPEQSQPTSTRTLRLEIPGGKVANVSGSPDDLANLEGLLDQLAISRRVS